MTKNLGTFERIARLLGVLIFGFLWLYAPGAPFAKVLYFALAAWSLWEAASGSCPFYAHLGMRKKGDALPDDRLYLVALLGMQATLAYEWWHAGWEKLNGTFLAELPKTLGYFASKNPYPFYRDFLTRTALPNANTFGILVQYGQLLLAVALVITAVFIVYGKRDMKRLGYLVAAIALFAGAKMNAHFWLAAGWTGPATAGSNVVMFWPELLLGYVWIVKYLSTKD